ncbi:ABC transporter substrate-binding protein [Neptunomonas phycophila]|uniref:ABC transporter substrate-binding protein n=1 Tax=Neptunomonas phycophila TaxID=1572645 RepID=UPI000ABE9804|nr:ABC transporter substrate-binding protein [Neptunomonas phycophila]
MSIMIYKKYAPLLLACAVSMGTCFHALAEPPARLKIGVSVSDLGNPFFARIAQGAKAKAQELVGDNAEVILVSSAYDVERQRRQIDQFVSQRVDMILLSAAVYDAFEEAIARAQQAGVKVLAVDVNAAGADATVTTNNPQAGEIACQYIAEQINGAGNVVILNGPQVSSIIERVQGCETVLADYPDITILSDDRNSGGSREGGLEMMTHLLMIYPHIDAVFTINDPAALGAEVAAQQSGRDEFIIVSVDGAPSVIEAMSQPNTLIRGTATQSPTQMAKKAVEMGYELMQGHTLETNEVLIPAVLITPENNKSAKTW